MKNKTPGPEILGWWPARGARFKRSIWHKILKISSFLWWSIYISRCLSIYKKNTAGEIEKRGKNGNLRNPLQQLRFKKIPTEGMSILLALFGLVDGLTGCLHVYGLPDHGKPLASVSRRIRELGDGNSNIFLRFTPDPWGRWSHFYKHIFQTGWNHQLEKIAGFQGFQGFVMIFCFTPLGKYDVPNLTDVTCAYIFHDGLVTNHQLEMSRMSRGAIFGMDGRSMGSEGDGFF